MVLSIKLESVQYNACLALPGATRGTPKKKNLIRNRFGVPSSSNISNSLYDFDNSKWIKLITRLRLCLSHLQEHKFKHSFQRLTHYATGAMVYCPQVVNERRTLLSTTLTTQILREFKYHFETNSTLWKYVV